MKKSLAIKCNEVGELLLGRGYKASGFPYNQKSNPPNDILDIAEGRMSNVEFEKTYPPRPIYQVTKLPEEIKDGVTYYYPAEPIEIWPECKKGKK